MRQFLETTVRNFDLDRNVSEPLREHCMEKDSAEFNRLRSIFFGRPELTEEERTSKGMQSRPPHGAITWSLTPGASTR
jgi:hypothetical protein